MDNKLLQPDFESRSFPMPAHNHVMERLSTCRYGGVNGRRRSKLHRQKRTSLYETEQGDQEFRITAHAPSLIVSHGLKPCWTAGAFWKHMQTRGVLETKWLFCKHMPLGRRNKRCSGADCSFPLSILLLAE